MLGVLLVLHYSTNAQIALFSHGTLVISDTANRTLVSRIFGVDENNSATWLTFAQNKLSHCFCKRVNCWGAFLHTPFILHCPALCIRRPHFEGVAVPTPQCVNCILFKLCTQSLHLQRFPRISQVHGLHC